MPPTIKKTVTCFGSSCGGLSTAKCQAPVTVGLRPAQWTWQCSDRTWAKIRMDLSYANSTEPPTPQTVIKALSFLEADDRNFIIRRNDGGKLEAWFVTPYFQWIDYVKGTFTTTEKSKVTAVLTSGSTGAFPSSCLCAPLMSCLFGTFCPCIFIEDGDGKNLQHLMEIVRILEEQGLTVAFQVDVWGSADRADPRYASKEPMGQGMMARDGEGGGGVPSPTLRAPQGSFA